MSASAVVFWAAIAAAGITTLGLFIAALRGVAGERLVLLAIGVIVALWLLVSLTAPSDDPDWSKATIAEVYGAFAFMLFVVWVLLIGVGEFLAKFIRRRSDSPPVL